MGQLGQSPTPADNARFLQTRSVVGQKIDFVETTASALGVLTLSAAGSAINFDFGTITATFSYTIDDVTYPWESILAWQYANFYVDGMGVGPGFDTNLYRYGSNVSGTTAALRKPMLVNIFGHNIYTRDLTDFEDTYSHVNIWYLQNSDSSSHVIGVDSIWKYIVYGGPNA